MKYECTYETRKNGAIGSWQKTTVTVNADSIGAAMDIAHTQLSQDHQLRFPVACNGLTGENLRKPMAEFAGL